MAQADLSRHEPTPELPAWPEAPVDSPSAVRSFKAAARSRLEHSGRRVEDVFGVIQRLVHDRTREIRTASQSQAGVWPEISYQTIEDGSVSASSHDLIRRRGCLVIRNHFERSQALEWDRQIVEYVDGNDFASVYRGRGDEFFSEGSINPTFYPIYWSQAQMQARQSERMTVVQSFLNGMWSTEEPASMFDPSRSVMYPDRLRRRQPGATTEGLGNHIDAGTLDLWLKPEYQRAFRHVFDGRIEEFDPWDATARTDGSQYPGTTMTSVFRTFQGWTALSDMAHDQGVLHAVPIPEAIAYLLLRPLLDDVADDDLCGVALSRSFRITEEWHGELLQASSGIPDIQAGDSVWWHGDLIHSVAPVHEQKGWGNVMYIPAAPWCPRNARYAEQVVRALDTGSSPSDFPEEHYERNWPDRFAIADLNEQGRRSLGLLG